MAIKIKQTKPQRNCILHSFISFPNFSFLVQTKFVSILSIYIYSLFNTAFEPVFILTAVHHIVLIWGHFAIVLYFRAHASYGSGPVYWTVLATVAGDYSRRSDNSGIHYLVSKYRKSTVAGVIFSTSPSPGLQLLSVIKENKRGVRNS